jgi:hypothetical protein
MAPPRRLSDYINLLPLPVYHSPLYFSYFPQFLALAFPFSIADRPPFPLHDFLVTNALRYGGRFTISVSSPMLAQSVDLSLKSRLRPIYCIASNALYQSLPTNWPASPPSFPILLFR